MLVYKDNKNGFYSLSKVTVLAIPFVLSASVALAIEPESSFAQQQSALLQPNTNQFTIRPAYSSDLASLTVADKKKLDIVVKQYKNKVITRLEVSGHTDSSIIRPRSRGLFADNYALSLSRAQNVANYLKSKLNVDDAKIEVIGLGKDKHVVSNATAKGRATNRRVELSISAKAISEPVVKEVITAKPTETITDGFTLREAVEKAIKSNPDILIQVNERRSRNEEVERAKAGYLPTLDLNAGIGTERSENSSTRGTGRDSITLTRREASLSARQMLFDGFATKSEVERQRARVSSTAYTVQGVADNTALDAAEAYLNLLRSETQLKLAQENLDSHKRSFDQIKIRSEAGVGRRADLEQISGRLALANSNLIAAQSNYDDSVTVYIRVVGEAPTGTLIKPEKQPGMPGNRDDAIKQAIAKHPTLKSAVADVEATFAQHRASRHAFYPRFDLELSQSWNRDLDGQVGINNDAQAMVRMRYNLLNGGGDAARKRQTAHLIDEAKEVRNRTYRQVVETMRLSWNAFAATEQQLIYLDEHVKATVRTRDAYQKQFNIGQRTLLDLLNAENELFQAKQSYISADFDNLFSRYRILNAKGALLEKLEISLPKEARLKNEG